MRPVGVVELLELAQGVQQVRLVPDQGPVGQFAAAGLHPAFHDRVHSGHLDPAEHGLDARVLEDGVEQAGELAVAVPDQEPRPASGVLEVHDEVPRGLGDPGGSGMRGCAEDPDPPGGVLDDRQYGQARAGQGDGLEEVAGEQGIGLGAEEAGPGGGGALGCRVDPGVVEDLPHGGGGDLDAEDEEFAVDAPVAPARVLSCQAQYEQADGADGARQARATGAGSGRVAAASRSRCQRSTVSGRISSRNRPSTSRGAVAAGRPGTPGRWRSRGRVVPSCRSSTVIWWRSARISASLSRSLTGSSRSNANTFLTPR